MKTLVINLMKEGQGMKKAVILAAAVVCTSFGLLAAEFSFAAGAIEHLGLADAVVGGKPLKAAAAVKTLQGGRIIQMENSCLGFSTGILANKDLETRVVDHQRCSM
jgi:hypothetical protein